MQSLFMGVDIGTSSVRAALFDANGIQKFLESEEYSISASVDGKAEMDPDTIIRATFDVIKKCVNKSGIGKNCIEGIGLSCQMHSLMVVGKDGKPMTKLLVWADTRAGNEAKTLEENYDTGKLYEATGCRVQHPMYPLSKILWIKNHEPAIFDNAFKFFSIKEYFIYTLFGEYVVDYTIASCQGFYNIHTQNWDDDITDQILGISKNQLSEVVECDHVMKGFKKEYEDIMGINRDTAFVIGSGDGIMANLGCGVFDDSALSSTIGTSGAVRMTVGKPLLDKLQQTWCYSFTKDKWVAGGAINNGGIALKWLRDELRQQFEADASSLNINIYKLFDRYAAEIPAGSDGLIFLPYLTGERSPDWNSGARGIMFGLSYTHGRKHIVRAAMEGVMYRMYSVYNILSDMQDNTQKIIASGGYSKSDIWLQIQADVFGRDVYVTGVKEASAFGAAYLAMCARGFIKYGQKLPAMNPTKIIHPSPAANGVYKKVYRQSMDIYHKLYGE